VTLPPDAYIMDLDSDLTEHLQWYGPSKLQPAHLGDTFADGRYVLTHKLDHDNHTLSWLARDLETDTWRRLDTLHTAAEMAAPRLNAALADIEQRRGPMVSQARADEQGLALAVYGQTGPNGRHVVIVWPLESRKNFFRSGVPYGGDRIPMDAAWFVAECARLRAGDPPRCVHDISELEMMAILGRPRIILVDDELRRAAFVSRLITPEQIPNYLVLRPDRIVDPENPDEDEIETDSDEWPESDEEADEDINGETNGVIVETNGENPANPLPEDDIETHSEGWTESDGEADEGGAGEINGEVNGVVNGVVNGEVNGEANGEIVD
jgi:hypothetical protein